MTEKRKRHCWECIELTKKLQDRMPICEGCVHNEQESPTTESSNETEPTPKNSKEIEGEVIKFKLGYERPIGVNGYGSFWHIFNQYQGKKVRIQITELEEAYYDRNQH